MTMKQRCGNITESICSVVRSIRRNVLPWWNKKEERIDRRRFLGFPDEKDLRRKIEHLFKDIKSKMRFSRRSPQELKRQFNDEYLSLKRILFDMLDEWEVSCHDPDFLSHDEFEWKEKNFMNAVNEAIFFHAAVTSAECEYSHIPMSSSEKEMNLYYYVQREIRGFEKGLLVYDPIFDHICDSRRKYTYLSELPYETILSDLSYEERNMEIANFRMWARFRRQHGL